MPERPCRPRPRTLAVVLLAAGLVGCVVPGAPGLPSGAGTAATPAAFVPLVPALVPAMAGPAASSNDAEDGAEATTLREALLGGEVSLEARIRMETVEERGFEDDATAVTMRTALGYATRPIDGWDAFFEIENVNDFGEAYNNTLNGRTDRPTIADPEATEVNQAWIRKRFDKTSVKAGRQVILLDKGRFIGDAPWRQNQQTFDAVSIEHEVDDRLDLFYAWVRNANRGVSDDNPAGDVRQHSHLAHARYALDDEHALSGYWYYLDFERDDAFVGFSTSTIGARLTGAAPALHLARYALEYAHQNDVDDNPNRVDAGYVHATAGTMIGDVSVDIGREILGGSNRTGGAVSTPLARRHGPNGWADVFLNTPDAGLEDCYVSLQGPVGPARWRVDYHDFRADATSADYGTEWDLSLMLPINERTSCTLKWADYDADEFSVDQRRAWVTIDIRN